MNIDTLPAGHYAVATPDGRMTYWRMTISRSRRKLAPWPATANYGPPVPTREDAEGLDRDGIAELRRDYFAKLQEFMDTVLAALLADPDAAAARFAEFTFRCLWCGRTLRDAKSKTLGVGPDCRRSLQLDDAALSVHVTPAIATAHAVHFAALERA